MSKQIEPAAREDGGADLLYGAPAIAAHLGLRVRQARHQIDEGRIPTFRIGAIICARKSSLLRWFEDQERQKAPSDGLLNAER